ncbi:hypothetical protein [Streptomyces lavendulocolor]|uniref:hypothetical protein n=1 Tax=Streptomyces lavendulocolor TaxID=67316 RepID=UPI003C2B4669
MGARRRIRLLEQENEVLLRAAAYLSRAHLLGIPAYLQQQAGPIKRAGSLVVSRA